MIVRRSGFASNGKAALSMPLTVKVRSDSADSLSKLSLSHLAQTRSLLNLNACILKAQAIVQCLAALRV